MRKQPLAPKFVIELPEEAYVQTRNAAAAWLYALNYEPDQDIAQLKPLLQELFPCANLKTAEALALVKSPFEDISNDAVNDVLNLTHGNSYERLPWREATLKILIRDFLADLKSPSSQLCEDAIQRVTTFLDAPLRGTTKNATQIIAGQRTKIRKLVRSLVLASLYLMNYRKTLSIDDVIAEVENLIKPNHDDDFFVDTFPMDDFLDVQGNLTPRARLALNEARKFIHLLIPARDEIDDIIQRSSKKWRISRMSIVDLNIIRIATYEIMHVKGSQPCVFINEAVELSKVFGSDKSRNFVNGLLQQICDDNKISVT